MASDIQDSDSREKQLHEVLAAYLEATRLGRPLHRDHLLAQHPDLAEKLRSFFQDQDRFAQLAEPLHPAARPVGPDDTATVGPGEGVADPALGTVRYVGDYELLSELGRGGMGVVYKARQTTLNRLVALKMILSGAHAGEADLARFRTEAEALARLQHPSIVQVYEIGTHEGKPYFSLEFCHGGSLDRKLDGTPLPALEAARLLQTLAQAMHAAHQAHVIHRDLKPANVLLTADGTPKITDFGLAKKLDGEPGAPAHGVTQSGAVMGTPSYMAPEQAGGKSKELGPACDVYALGAILYELLTGRPPFKAATPLDTLLQVMTDEPVPPTRLQSKTPRDLETICLKCLHKEPARRYASAGALADDIGRFQAGEPIAARPVGPLERTVKWIRRRPAAAALLALSLLTALTLAGGGLWFTARLAEERNAAVEARGEADEKAADEAAARLRANQEAHNAEVRKQEAETQRSASETARYSLLLHLVTRDLHEHRVSRALERLEQCPKEQRGGEWHFLRRLCERNQPWQCRSDRVVVGLAYFADAKSLAMVELGGRVSVLDASSAKLLRSFTGPSGMPPQLAVSPDGRQLVAAAVGKVDEPGGVMAWDATTGKEEWHLPPGSHPHFTPDGKQLALLDHEGKLAFFDRNGKLSKRWTGPGGPFAFTSDGRQVIVGGRNGVRILDSDAGRLVREIPIGGPYLFDVQEVTISPDGRFLAVRAGTNSATGTGVRLLDLTSGAERLALNEVIHQVAFSPDGRRLAVTVGATVRFWEVESCQPAFTWSSEGIERNFQTLVALAFSPDGQTIAAGGGFEFGGEVDDLDFAQELGRLTGGGVRLWNLAAPTASDDLAAGVRGTWVRWAPGGRLLAVGGEPFRATVFNRDTGQTIARLEDVRDVAFAPDGKRFAALLVHSNKEGKIDAAEIRVADASSGRLLKEPIAVPPAAGTANRLHFLAGSCLAFLWETGLERAVQLWDYDKNQFRVRHVWGGIREAVFSPDGEFVAEPFGADILIVSAAGRQGRWLKGHAGFVDLLAFSPDGRTLVSAGQDGTCRAWPLAGGEPVVYRYQGMPRGLVLPPDGTRAAIVVDSQVHVWDLTSGQKLLVFASHNRPVHQVRFSSDGRRAASSVDRANGQGELRVWDAQTGWQLCRVRGVEGGWWLSADGRRVVGISEDQRLRVWETDSGLELVNQPDTPFLAGLPDGRVLAGKSEDGVSLWRFEAVAADDPVRRESERALKLGWHRREAAGAEHTRPFGAAFHLSYLLEATPNDGNLAFQRGQALARLKRWAEALEDFRRAVKHGEDLDTVHNGRGEALLQLGRPVEAADAFQAALLARSGNPIVPTQARDRAYFGWVEACADQGRWDEVLAAAGRAEETLGPAVRWQAELWRGRALTAGGQWAEAVTAYDKALKGVRDDDPRWAEAAGVRLAAGDAKGYADARAHLIRLARRQSNAAVVRSVLEVCVLAPDTGIDVLTLADMARQVDDPFLRGAALLRAGAWEAAVRELAAVKGSDAVTLGFLTLAQAKLGQQTDSRRNWEKAQELAVQADKRGWTPQRRAAWEVVRREVGPFLKSKP